MVKKQATDKHRRQRISTWKLKIDPNLKNGSE